MRGLFSALAFLTVIPVPAALQAKKVNAMFAWYPAAGLLVGCILASAAAAASALLPPMLAAVAMAAAGFFLTGGLHLDGLADCADAFYGRKERERVLEILKDPRIGTMGGAAIGLSLLARTAALFSLRPPLLLLALPAGVVISRTLVVIALKILPYARREGGVLSAEEPAQAPAPGLLLFCSAVVGGVGVIAPLPAAAACGASGVLWFVSWRKIRGCTGDVLGATIELAEMAFLVVLAAEASARAPLGFLPAVQTALGLA